MTVSIHHYDQHVEGHIDLGVQGTCAYDVVKLVISSSFIGYNKSF
jgi:hypothetical protein